MKFHGKVIAYGDNVDTDVIIPARYLNTIDKKELASHCMEAVSYTHLDVYKRQSLRCVARVSLPWNVEAAAFWQNKRLAAL